MVLSYITCIYAFTTVLESVKLSESEFRLKISHVTKIHKKIPKYFFWGYNIWVSVFFIVI